MNIIVDLIGSSMINEFFKSILYVKGPLTFWSFFLAIVVIIVYIIFRSDNFNKIWSSVVGKSLKGTQVYRILRLFMILFFLLSIITILLIFFSPLALKYLEHSEKVLNNFQVTQDRLNKVLNKINISDDESTKFKEEYKKARLLKENKDYKNAIAYFKSLHNDAKYGETKDSLIGLTTNCYYSAGKYIEGIEYICELYEQVSYSDYRFRFDIHAHIRKIALENGFEKAEVIINRLKRKYKRNDISYVWIAIPLAKMEYLKKGYTYDEEHFYLSEKEEDYLRKIIELYPNDTFIDHAYYFLKKPDIVLEKYPNSLILDVAMIMAAKKSLNQNEKRKILTKYLDIWPHTNRKKTILNDILDTYFAEGDIENALKFKQANFKLTREFNQWRFCYFREYGLSNILLLADNSEYKNEIIEGICRADFCFDIGKKEYLNGNFRRALELYEAEKKLLENYSIEPFQHINRAIIELTNINRLIELDTPESLLEIGNYLRNYCGVENNKLLSIAIFKSLIDKYPYTVESEKSYYLIASIFRQLKQHKSSFEICKEFLERYPNSILADDIIAEIIVYYLLIVDDILEAEYYLEFLLKQFPEGNAVDNAINWIAWYHLRAHNYHKALTYYTMLSIQWVKQQRGKLALNPIYKLQAVIDLSKDRKEIEGIEIETVSRAFPNQSSKVIVKKVKNNSKAQKAGFNVDDHIMAVEGIGIFYEEQYYKTLNQFAINQPIIFTIYRYIENENEEIEEKQILLNTTVDIVKFYPVPYDRSYWNYKGIGADLSLQLEIEDFVIKYLNYNSANDVFKIMSLYDNDVDYCEKGIINNETLGKLKMEDVKIWPSRANSIASKIEFCHIDLNIYRTNFRFDFSRRIGKKSIEGKVDCELILKRLTNRYGYDKFKIVKEYNSPVLSGQK